MLLLQNYNKEMNRRRNKGRIRSSLSFILLYPYDDSLWKTNGHYPDNDHGTESWKCVNYSNTYIRENHINIGRIGAWVALRVCVFSTWILYCDNNNNNNNEGGRHGHYHTIYISGVYNPVALRRPTSFVFRIR